MTDGKASGRLKLLAALVAIMFAALTTRLWFLQVLAVERYRQEARRNIVRTATLPAPRGRILDVNGEVLVGNRLSLVVTVNRQELGDRVEEVLLGLSELLDIPATELGSTLEENSRRYYPHQPVPLIEDLPERVAYFILEHQADFPGVAVVEEPVRTYPQGDLAAHVLGHVRQISEEQLKEPRYEGYEGGDIVGQGGVEAVYEHHLRGAKGLVKYLVDAEGEYVRQLGATLAPLSGGDLVLSLDAETQQLVEEALEGGMGLVRGRTWDEASGRYLRADAGAAVVMDSDTGAIIAMASLPSFDPRNYELSGKEFDRWWARVNAPSAGQPLTNRAVAGNYPPGSTFKPFVALAAMRNGIASPGGYYPCPPTYQVPGDTSGTIWNNWTSRNFGSISLSYALTISCDTVFYAFGNEFWELLPKKAQGLVEVAPPSREVLQEDLAAFGFGEAPRLDLPHSGELAGRLPTSRWKYELFEREQQKDRYNRCIAYWCPGDYVNMSIGQGFIAVTPLQLAVAYSAIANGGRLCAPHVAVRVQSAEGDPVRRVKPRCGRRLPYSSAQLAFIRRALATVPASGTAALAFRGFPFSEVTVAGKTGTAEVPGKQDFSWFAAMAPADDPKYVVVALVEQGGHGSTTAAPIVRSILEGLYGLPRSGFVPGGVTD